MDGLRAVQTDSRTLMWFMKGGFGGSFRWRKVFTVVVMFSLTYFLRQTATVQRLWLVIRDANVDVCIVHFLTVLFIHFLTSLFIFGFVGMHTCLHFKSDSN